MTTVIRPASINDLVSADALVVASINDLTTRHGFGAIAQPSPPRLQRFSLENEPEGLWVAERDGQLVGFGFSWTNEHLWFLAQLFVEPGLQDSGIGRELLARTLLHARSRNARARVLITFAFNRASQGLYMQHGLYPVCPLYVMSVGQETLASHGVSSPLRTKPLGPLAPVMERLIEIDRASLGVSRLKHHRYMLTEGGLKGFSLWSGAECVGYAYLGPEGHIGPLAVTDATHSADAFRAALKAALQVGSQQVSAFVPGDCRPVLDVALRVGMRITLPMLLMSDGLPTPWDRYLPRNPGLM